VWERRRGAGSRHGLEVRTDHRSHESREGESSQARNGDTDSPPPRGLLVRVERTHDADLRERESGKLLVGAGPLAAFAAGAGMSFRERNPLRERRSSDGPAQREDKQQKVRRHHD
jgi:hypothetical protein